MIQVFEPKGFCRTLELCVVGAHVVVFVTCRFLFQGRKNP